MPDAVTPSRESPLRRYVLPLLVIAAFAAGFLLRGADCAPPRASSGASAPPSGERLAAPAADAGRYMGVVAEVRSDAVVVIAPDRSGPGAEQHPVTLRVTSRTRINSLLERGLEQGLPPEEGGDPATLGDVRNGDVVGFTGGSPFDASAFDASTITIISRPPSIGGAAR